MFQGIATSRGSHFGFHYRAEDTVAAWGATIVHTFGLTPLRSVYS